MTTSKMVSLIYIVCDDCSAAVGKAEKSGTARQTRCCSYGLFKKRVNPKMMPKHQLRKVIFLVKLLLARKRVKG